MKRLKMDNPNEIRRAITKIVNWTVNSELEPKVANAALYGCSTALNAIKVFEQEKRIAEIAAALTELEAEQK